MQVGLTLSEIDNITLYELKMVIEVKNRVSKQESEDSMNKAIVQAYYTEVFRRQDRAKKLPPLKKFLIDYNKKELTKEEKALQMLEKAKAITAMFGGDIVIN